MAASTNGLWSVNALALEFGMDRRTATQILRTATHVFTAKDKPLVATIPTYEECADYATLMGNKVIGVSLNSDFTPDLDN